MASSSGGTNNGIELTFQLKKVTISRAILDTAIVLPATRRAGARAVKYVQEELRKADRVDTGLLHDSIRVRYELTPQGPQATVYTNVKHALWVEQGTANDGTGYIYPTQAKLLRFNPNRRSGGAGRRGVYNNAERGRGSGRFVSAYVFAPRVRGQKGVHYMEKGLKRMRSIDFV